jgi:hypothetical protein
MTRSSRPLRPTRGTPLLLWVSLAGAAALGGCIRTVDLGTVEVAQDIRGMSTVRSASNLPGEFTVATPARPGECPAQLRDDVLGVVLTLHRSMQLPVRSAAGTRYESFGDYRARPAGHYGDAEPGDGLRIDCARMSAVGVVKLGVPGG